MDPETKAMQKALDMILVNLFAGFSLASNPNDVEETHFHNAEAMLAESKKRGWADVQAIADLADTIIEEPTN